MTEESISERKRQVRYFTCDVCGHTWRSYGYGERVKCPKCYEQRTGKKFGSNAEFMNKIRPKKTAALPDEVGEPAPMSAPPIESEAKKSRFLDFLNKEIF